MTEQPSPPIQYHDDYADQAQRLASLGLNEDGIAHMLGVPVYTGYEWMETKPEFAAAVEQGWAHFGLKPPRPLSRYKYPAYNYALRLAARVNEPELAQVLKATMAEMRAIGPHAMAAFNDALRAGAMAIQPLRYIPKRAGA